MCATATPLSGGLEKAARHTDLAPEDSVGG